MTYAKLDRTIDSVTPGRLCGLFRLKAASQVPGRGVTPLDPKEIEEFFELKGELLKT